MNKKVNKKYSDEARSCCDAEVALQKNSDPFANSFTPGNTTDTKEEQLIQIALMRFDRGLVTGVDGTMVWRIADIDSGDYIAHQRVRSGSDFQTIIENLKHLAQIKNEKNCTLPQIGLETMLTKENIHQMRGILDLPDQVNARQILISNLLPYNSIRQRCLCTISQADLSFETNIFRQKCELQKWITNDQSIANLLLTERSSFRLRVTLIPVLWRLDLMRLTFWGTEKKIKRMSLGNVFQNDIFQIWNSEIYHLFWDKFRYYDFPNCFSCPCAEICLK